MVRSVEDSKAINDLHEPCIIMASSGMCTAGRIKFHLRMNIKRPESTILFVGYQSQGTLGRQILEVRGNSESTAACDAYVLESCNYTVFPAMLTRPVCYAGSATCVGHPGRSSWHTVKQTVALNFATLLRKLRCNVSVPSYQESVEL